LSKHAPTPPQQGELIAMCVFCGIKPDEIQLDGAGGVTFSPEAFAKFQNAHPGMAAQMPDMRRMGMIIDLGGTKAASVSDMAEDAEAAQVRSCKAGAGRPGRSSEKAGFPIS
jgi:hypothetical protein